LSNRHYVHPEDKDAFWEFNVTEMFDMINSLFTGIKLLAVFVGLGSLLAGIIGVGNIMWIIVRERTQEFGIRRAIGARPSDITIQVLSESIVLTLVAGIAGVCFAVLILGVMDKVTFSDVLGRAGFQISFSIACAVVIIFFILGTLAGTVPALKAMRIKPIEAMRDK
ncbi:MAG: FtsX-like permease family protein, partial [Muribaculaceae bacterium]|nr:FtsX-like permease family protein [Muribaculaceae bacterium]